MLGSGLPTHAVIIETCLAGAWRQPVAIERVAVEKFAAIMVCFEGAACYTDFPLAAIVPAGGTLFVGII